MNLSLIELVKPYEQINISFQQFILRITNGTGNFHEFATSLSWRSQLGMVLTYLDVVHNCSICIVPNGGMVVKKINERQYCVATLITEPATDCMVRYYRCIELAFQYLTKPF